MKTKKQSKGEQQPGDGFLQHFQIFDLALKIDQGKETDCQTQQEMEQYAGYDPGGNREIAFREVVEQNIQFGDNIEDQYDLEVLYRRYMGRIAPHDPGSHQHDDQGYGTHRADPEKDRPVVVRREAADKFKIFVHVLSKIQT